MSKTVHTFRLNDDERETLLHLLDFACNRLDERMEGTVTNWWDSFSIKLARTKLVRLRGTMFPMIRPTTASGK